MQQQVKAKGSTWATLAFLFLQVKGETCAISFPPRSCASQNNLSRAFKEAVVPVEIDLIRSSLGTERTYLQSTTWLDRLVGVWLSGFRCILFGAARACTLIFVSAVDCNSAVRNRILKSSTNTWSWSNKMEAKIWEEQKENGFSYSAQYWLYSSWCQTQG
jgi:hypothetical protein